jgi:DNA-binding transcriptional LysR family regulator
MIPRLDSELLRTFAAVADSGSFTRAAELVGRTQSAVSMQVKKLERTVGRALFRREARGVHLTATGEDLLIRARPILRLLDRAAEGLHGGPVEGAVRVGVPEEYGASLLPRVLARFAERHPGVQVTVRCETSLRFPAAVERGELDLAVIVSDRGEAQGEVLLHDPTVWVTSARHLTHERDPLPIALFESGCWWRDWSLKALDEQGLSYRIAYSSASIAGIQAAISSGLAIGVLGQSTLPPGTQRLSAAEGFRELPASTVVLRTAGAASEAARSMADAIREAFRGPSQASRAAA